MSKKKPSTPDPLLNPSEAPETPSEMEPVETTPETPESVTEAPGAPPEPTTPSEDHLEPELEPDPPPEEVHQVEKPVPEIEADAVRHHLEVLLGRSLEVEEFRDETGTGTMARSLLDSYIAQGLVKRAWVSGGGQYSLTEEGLKYLGAS